MPHTKKRQSNRELLLERGWRELAPGVYVVDTPGEVSAQKFELIAEKTSGWTRKFEAVEENAIRVFVEAGETVLSEKPAKRSDGFARLKGETQITPDVFEEDD